METESEMWDAIADARWSKDVRTRDNYTCQHCGTQHPTNSFGVRVALHAAHIFSRGIKRTRHDQDNGITLCYECHVVFDSKMTREEREVFARMILGDARYDDLRIRAR